jgi:photosystem II stability/assembly factor-like uncharacterized protein
VIRHNHAVRRSWNRFGLSLLAWVATLAVAAGAARGAAAAPPAGDALRAAYPVAPSPAGETPAFVKQFEETSYYLEDLAFVTPDVGWAVGQVHWDAARKQYVGTIVKTTDRGRTWAPQDAGVDESLRGLSFPDQNQGWAVGANGAIVHTADGGQHWTRQEVDTADSFRGVVFVDARNGWATSIKGVHRNEQTGEDNDWQGSVWHTGDGGQTWARQSLPESASLLNRIDFVDARHGWAVGLKRSGEDYSGPQHSAVIYRTADGGLTWTEAYAPDLAITLTGVDFVDADNGWAVGFITNSGIEGGAVFHTSDGGQTWERQDAGGFNRLLRDVQFVDRERGYIVGADYAGAWGPPVYRTLDGGKSWSEVRLPRHENDGLSAVAIVGDRLVAVGEHDYMVETDRAWADCAPKPTAEPPCDDCACLLKASYINTHYRLQDVFFTDASHGWAVGSRSFGVSTAGQVILHTADGGATWDTQYEDAPPADSTWSIYRLDGVYFSDTQTGWAVGRSEYFREDRPAHRGAILHTADGGKTWKQQGVELYQGVGEQTDRDREFFAVRFLDNRQGWALAESRYPDHTVFLAHTTDAGEHWTWVDTGVEGPLGVGYESVMGKLDFTDAQHGWVAGGLGLVLRSEDGGATWTKQELDCGYPNCSFALYALDILNGSQGAIAGQRYAGTSNGGARWSMPDNPYHVDFFDVQLTGGQGPQGWMAGNHGVVLHTDDGGNSWNLVQAGLLDPLFGLHFIDAQHGWFVGDYGAIVRYAAAQVPSGPATLLSPIWRPGQAMSGGAGVGVQVMYVP